MEIYVVHVTKECNCNCTYCYEKDKISTYTWGEIKSFIENILKYRTSNEFVIEFLGGEPMLAWNYIKKTYEYLEQIPNISVPKYVITTNGTILTEEIANYLVNNEKIRFAASLDGHKWANQLRVFKDGVNTYDKTVENLQYLNKLGVKTNVHMVTHPYNVGSIVSSIDDLYKKGITLIDLGTVESTITIDENYCKRFIQELDIVSQKIVNGEYPGFRIGLFESLKPKEDVRSYILDPDTGKTIGETYGRSGKDITHTNLYNTNRCLETTKVSEMIYYIRETVYNIHQSRISKVGGNVWV